MAGNGGARGEFRRGFWVGLGVMAAVVAAGLALRIVRI